MSMFDDSNVRTTQSENLRADSEVGEASERPAGDELVRVIGQDKLFNSMRKGAAEAEQRTTDRWPATVQLGSIADWLSRTHLATAEFRCSGASQDAKHARTYPHGDPLGEALRQPVSVDAGADDAQYASGTEGDGDGHDYVDPQGSYPSTDDQETAYELSYAGRERRRGSLITVAAVLGLAIVGTAGAFGYGTFTGSGSWSQPILIKADNTPTSIAPSPSSSDGQGSKLIHERADKSQPQPVVSQEQPIEVKCGPEGTDGDPGNRTADHVVSEGGGLCPGPGADRNRCHRTPEGQDICDPSRWRIGNGIKWVPG